MAWPYDLDRKSRAVDFTNMRKKEAPVKSGAKETKLNFGSITLIASSNSSTEGFTALTVNAIRWTKANNRCNTYPNLTKEIRLTTMC